jgi:hypothetical protein
MNCPECGAEQPITSEHCSCGYDFSAVPRKSLYKGADDDGDSRIRLRGPFRQCAKCGSAMTLYLVENMFINGLIPSGKRFYFQCGSCGKQIKLRSLWRNLLAIPGCFFFVMLLALFVSSPNWWVGIFTAALALYPLTLLFEIVRRIRYPSM